jgi:hypothetical protein
MAVRGAQQQIDKALSTWPGVASRPHRFGGLEYVYQANREIGHTHGDQLVDITLTRRLRDELVAAGRVEPHHVLPESGWITFRLRQPEDVAAAIELFRLAYEQAVRQKGDTGRP